MIFIFHIQKFSPFWGSQQPNFTSFWCPQQPNFTPYWCPRQPNFTPFGCPRQLLWTLLEGWGKAGVWQKVSLLKLRNTGAPSTKWGALLYCTLYTVIATPPLKFQFGRVQACSVGRAATCICIPCYFQSSCHNFLLPLYIARPEEYWNPWIQDPFFLPLPDPIKIPKLCRSVLGPFLITVAWHPKVPRIVPYPLALWPK